jgi:hypothetical protein
MPNRIDEALTQARQQLRRRRKLGSMHGEAHRILLDEQAKLSHYKRKLGDEQADVDKLTEFSLTGLFYSVLGTKEERLERERQELLAAKLKYDETVEAVDHAANEVERLEVELSRYHSTEADFERLLDEKERLLRHAGDGRTSTLLALTEQAADLAAELTELEEALQAGDAALAALEGVRDELRSAQNWGTWDLLGGGMLSTMAKHSHIDVARSRAHRAQERLHRFRAELADADQRLHVSLDDIGGFSTFADYFFDGLIADWVVQSKIDHASSACGNAIGRVREALLACRHRREDVQQQIEEAAERRRQFIEQA